MRQWCIAAFYSSAKSDIFPALKRVGGMQSDGGRRSRGERETPRPRDAIRQMAALSPARCCRGGASRSIVLASMLAALAVVLASAGRAQTIETIQVLRDVSELCSPQRILQEVGPADARIQPVASPINVLTIEYELSNPVKETRIVAVFWFFREMLDDATISQILRRYDISRERLRNLEECPTPFYSHSAKDRLSLAHENLVSVVWRIPFMSPQAHPKILIAGPYVLRPPVGPMAAQRPAPGEGSAQGKPSAPRVVSPRLPAETPLAKRLAKDKAAGGKVAALPLPAPEAGPAPKPLKRYPRPDYALLPSAQMQNAAVTDPAAAPRAAFAVEKVECSDEGNWMIGYFGFFSAQRGGGEFIVKRRHGVNNYPDEGRIALADLKAQKRGQLECSPGEITCSAPRQVRSYSEVARSEGRSSAAERASVSALAPVVIPVAPESAEKAAAWSCRPDKNLCVSKAADHWKCDPKSRQCLSYDPSRWWCAPRSEFCFSSVQFADWGGRLREGDAMPFTAADLIYDASEDFVRIVEDVMTRRCGNAGSAGNPSVLRSDRDER
jgi:hypothetical protein